MSLEGVEDAKERLTRLQAEKLQIEIDEKKKLLIPADEVKKKWEKIGSTVKTKILRIPTALAPVLAEETDPAEFEARLREELEEALKELGR